uniref:Transthyretin-like family-containing protein n=1 Tax=Strongyloides papillosus TaxID=174720 RepID=A0A0N5CGV5_STREA
MIIFKIFLIFLIIFNCKAKRLLFFINKYYIGVKGTITCKFSSRDDAYVSITAKPRDTYEKRPIFSARVNYGKSFFLKTKVKGIRKPRLFLRIVHSCVKVNFFSNDKFVVRRYVEEIPAKYIVKNYLTGAIYNRGNIELSRIR